MKRFLILMTGLLLSNCSLEFRDKFDPSRSDVDSGTDSGADVEVVGSFIEQWANNPIYVSVGNSDYSFDQYVNTIVFHSDTNVITIGSSDYLYEYSIEGEAEDFQYTILDIVDGDFSGSKLAIILPNDSIGGNGKVHRGARVGIFLTDTSSLYLGHNSMSLGNLSSVLVDKLSDLEVRFCGLNVNRPQARYSEFVASYSNTPTFQTHTATGEERYAFKFDFDNQSLSISYDGTDIYKDLDYYVYDNTNFAAMRMALSIMVTGENDFTKTESGTYENRLVLIIKGNAGDDSWNIDSQDNLFIMYESEANTSSKPAPMSDVTYPQGVVSNLYYTGLEQYGYSLHRSSIYTSVNSLTSSVKETHVTVK